MSRKSGPPSGARRRVVLWIVVQVVATALLLEGALRLIRPHHDGLANLLYLPSVSAGFPHVDNVSDLVALAPYQAIPGTVAGGFVLNSRGLRTHEYNDERSDGVRVVAIGDSFTWGVVPHRDTWPVRLEAELEESLERQDIEVISLGVPGVGPAYYLKMWELEGRRLRPDLVVVGFFVGNDLTDGGGDPLGEVRHGWLIEHSLVARALRNGIRLASSGMRTDRDDGIVPADPSDPSGPGGRMGYEIAGHAESYDPEQPTLLEATFLRIEWERMAICLDANRPMLNRHLRRVEPILSEFGRSVRASGAELLVFLIPDEYQVDDELSARLLQMNETDPAHFFRGLPQRKLVEILEAAGIHHIDGLRRFRARSRSESLYVPRDTHWNAAGNQLGAGMMADYILEARLLAGSEARP